MNDTKSKVGKMLASWSTLEVIQSQVEWLKENGGNEGKTDDQLFQIASEDPDLFDYNYDCLCDYLTELMSKNTHGGWVAEVNNFGWRSLNGHKYFQAMTGNHYFKPFSLRPNALLKYTAMERDSLSTMRTMIARLGMSGIT